MEETEIINILDASQFSYSGNFGEQTQEIFQNVRLTRQEVEYLQHLVDDVSHHFNAIWPGSAVLPFGSIVTGLGIKTSDVDCFIELPRWLLPPDISTVMKAKQILMKRRDIFHQLFAIIHAKVPIVKFFHAPTARHCDISFTSSMGVHNSRLIAHLINIDERVKKLAVLIKYWSKVYSLTGTNLLPNYCLTMLVIFFLQTKNILPPISVLQENGCELYIDDWNVAFEEITYDSTNNDTLYKLVGDFFKYYRHFKFDQLIISPFVGHPVHRELFSKAESVPEQFALYKGLVGGGRCRGLRLDSYMCVQDPVQHNRNCSVPVHPRLAHKLLTHFAAASAVFDRTDEGSFLQRLLNNHQFKEAPIKKKPKLKQVGSKARGVAKKKVTKNFTINIKNKIKYKMMSQK